METIKSMNLDESIEKNSTKKVVFYTSDTEENNKKAGYLGEFFIINGELKVKAVGEQERSVLMGRLKNLWVPQMGFPIIRKENGQFMKNEKGKLIIDSYALPSKDPDQFIEAVYDFTKAMGIFKVDLEEITYN